MLLLHHSGWPDISNQSGEISDHRLLADQYAFNKAGGSMNLGGVTNDAAVLANFSLASF